MGQSDNTYYQNKINLLLQDSDSDSDKFICMREREMRERERYTIPTWEIGLGNKT